MIKAIQRYKINHYFKNGQYDKALILLEPKAKSGDPSAQFLIGMVYSNAWNMIGDDDAFKAEKWFSKAAENGHLQAQIMLGDLYAIDAHIPARLHRALRWYQCARKSGHVESGRKLAALYLKYRDVISEDINSAGLLIEAADQGDYKAAVLLAWAYKKGLLGFPLDLNRFRYWWNKLKYMSKDYASKPTRHQPLHY